MCAFKVVGTGSVGTRDYCVYMEGNGPGDPLFLQIKEEVGSAYLPYVKRYEEGALGHVGRRGAARDADAVRSIPGMDDD